MPLLKFQPSYKKQKSEWLRKWKVSKTNSRESKLQIWQWRKKRFNLFLFLFYSFLKFLLFLPFFSLYFFSSSLSPSSFITCSVSFWVYIVAETRDTTNFIFSLMYLLLYYHYCPSSILSFLIFLFCASPSPCSSYQSPLYA